MSCPDEYPKLNKEKLECIKYNAKKIIEDLIINERNNSEKKTKEEEIEYYDNLIKIIEEIFLDNYNTSILDNGQDEYIKTEKMTVTFTTVQNQKNNINNNMTTIDLGECETLLRNEYNITLNETLYMKKIDIVQKGIKTPKIEYNIYCKLFGTNLIQLNLTACAKEKILFFIPYEINGNEDEYNSSSGYYNDICYTTTSEDGTDITLKDRQTKYIDEDKIICQEDCVFAKYDSKTSKANCSCNVKETPSSIADMTIDKAKIVLDNFKEIKNFANFNFLVCYKKLFNKKGVINNIGSYLLIVIMLFHIITIFIFYINQFPIIKMKINDIIFGIKEYQLISKYKAFKNKELIRRNQKHQNKIIKNNSDKIKMIAPQKLNKRNITKKKQHKSSKRPNIATIKIINNNNIVEYKKIIYSDNLIRNNNTYNIRTNNNNSSKKLDFNSKIDKQKRIENIMKYIDEEINIIPYNLALLNDKRTYCQYYTSLLKTKHNLIFALFNSDDYNSRIIKIDLFFIGFTICYNVNAFFYNDDTMHKIYKGKGKFDVEAQIPIIAYSSLISMLLKTLLNLLALSNDEIISFKQNKSKINLMKRAEDLTNKLTIKFILYFIISFLLLAFFWYYISMFGVIYKNTQVHLLKDTLMSFGLSLLYPFIIYLLPGLFRIPSLSNEKIKRECLYNFSKFLQIF